MKSVTLTVRVSPDLKAKIQAAAKKDQRTPSSLVVHALALLGVK